MAACALESLGETERRRWKDRYQEGTSKSLGWAGGLEGYWTPVPFCPTPHNLPAATPREVLLPPLPNPCVTPARSGACLHGQVKGDPNPLSSPLRLFSSLRFCPPAAWVCVPPFQVTHKSQAAEAEDCPVQPPTILICPISERLPLLGAAYTHTSGHRLHPHTPPSPGTA